MRIESLLYVDAFCSIFERTDGPNIEKTSFAYDVEYSQLSNSFFFCNKTTQFLISMA